jgi:anaerobic selenocysteine-containing dehydrogenase
METLYTVCARDCYDTCSLVVHSDAGKPVSLQGDGRHAVTQGFVCPRGAKDLERVYRNRVLYPHQRTGGKPGGPMERVAWPDALTMVAARLSETLVQHGPESVLYLDYSGNTGLLANVFPQRLWTALHATRHDNSLCTKSGHAALRLHYGTSYGLQPDTLPQQKLVVWWGFNPAVSAPHLWKLALRARREEGAQIVVIDPRRSETAAQADLWLRPQPECDVALAYGIAHCLLRDRRVDNSFLAKWCNGVAEFAAAAEVWTPAHASETCGVAAADIEKLAAIYGELRPSATMIGIGLQKAREGAESVRAIALLPALVGRHRGFFYSNSAGYAVDEAYLRGQSMTTPGNVVSQVGLGEHLAAGRFRFIFIAHMNPAMTLPAQQAVRAGLARPDVFVVVHDPHWTTTCEFADVVLPAQTYLEKEDVVVPWTHNYLRRSVRVLMPQGESRHEIELMATLARQLHRAENWLYAEPWQELRHALAKAIPAGGWEKLMAGEMLQLDYRPADLYPTASDKIELFSQQAQQQGFSPLPSHLPAAVMPAQFILLNSALARYTHTQFQDVYGSIPATLSLHPDDARRLGIGDGCIVEMASAHGATRLRAVVSDEVPQGVVWSPKETAGLDGKPQNGLVAGERQRLGNGSLFNSTRVTLRRV